jgi:hypothetical protein
MNLQKTEHDKDQVGKFIPTTVRKRMYLLDDIVAELNRRKFTSLDETRPDDLKKIISIVSDITQSPTTTR